MMAMGTARQKWDLPSRVEDKRKRKTDAESNWKKVCAEVTRRDGGRCRVTGQRCDANAIDMLRRGEHHHIVFRSAGGADSTANVILVTKQVHDDIHAGRTRIEGDGDLGISVWSRGLDGEMYLSFRETGVNAVEHD